MNAVTGAWQVRPTMPAEVSRRLVDTAIGRASSMSTPVTVVTVDESGVIKELHRMDGAPLVSVQTAWNKAYAAAAIGMPPDDFYSAIESDGAAVASFTTRPGIALIGGGIPVVDGRVAGAIGVAGAMTAAEDRLIAEAAAGEADQAGRRLVQLECPQPDADLRLGGLKGRDEPGRQLAAGRDVEADGQLAADRPGGAARRGHGAVQVGQRGPRAVQEGRAGRGERHPPAGPFQELDAERVLERADLRAQHLLGDVHGAGRRGEARRLRDGGEIAQVTQLDVHPRPIVSAGLPALGGVSSRADSGAHDDP
jgi:uncharacterized protein GlcG (DUF336 family)